MKYWVNKDVAKYIKSSKLFKNNNCSQETGCNVKIKSEL